MYSLQHVRFLLLMNDIFFVCKSKKMDFEKRRYCIESLKESELLLKEMLLESKERTNACLKIHEAALWVESITVEGSDQSLTAELFSNTRRRKQKRQEGQRRRINKNDSSSTNSPS